MTDTAVPLTPAIARAVLDRLGLDGSAVVGTPWRGPHTAVYPLGDRWVIKVPDGTSTSVADIAVQARMAPVARAAGVRTPRIVGSDDSRSLLPVPYLVFERVPGVPVERGGRWSHPGAPVWGQLGQQLALVHAIAAEVAPEGLRRFEQSPELDPRPWAEQLTRRGVIDGGQGRRLAQTLDTLAPVGLTNPGQVLCHGDVNLANLVIDPATGVLNGLIDWAGAGWLDAAWDVVGLPLEVVPAVLAGHRSISPLPKDSTAEARIAWWRLQSTLHQQLHQTAAPPADWVSTTLDQIERFLHRI